MNDKDPMKIPERNDYLWDGSGTPDPEIQRLELLLAEFRHDGQPLVFPETLPNDLEGAPSFSRSLRKGWVLSSLPLLAAAAVILLALAAGFFSFQPGTLETQVAWECSALAGNPQIGSQEI